MKLQSIKYHICTKHHSQGILLVDIDTEDTPYTDKMGRRQYYCLDGKHIFAIDPAEEEQTRLQEQMSQSLLL